MEKKVIEMEKIEKKAAVNVLDLLLGADKGKIKTPFKDVEISRLSELFEAPFIVRCEALTPEKYESIQDMAVNIQGKDVDLDMNALQILTVIEGVKAITEDASGERKTAGLLFKNADLMSHFEAPTPKELCRKLLLSGEVSNLYNVISKLSGFSDASIKEIKN